VQPRGIERSVLLWVSLVGFAWLGLVALILLYPFQRDVSADHWLLVGASIVVALLTCGPVEQRLRAYGLTIRAMVGLAVVTHIVVFMTVPTRSMLTLSEIPVYVLIAVGVVLTVGSTGMPVAYAIGKRLFARRSRRHDVSRAWRHAMLCGAGLSGMIVLIGLRAFTPILAGLWVLMLAFFEYIVLTYSEPIVQR
jgi:hypothetical protein